MYVPQCAKMYNIYWPLLYSRGGGANGPSTNNMDPPLILLPNYNSMRNLKAIKLKIRGNIKNIKTQNWVYLA